MHLDPARDNSPTGRPERTWPLPLHRRGWARIRGSYPIERRPPLPPWVLRRRTRRHDGSPFLSMRGSDRTSQISILRRRRSPGGKGRLLRSLGLRRPRVLPLVAPSLLVARRRRRHRPSRPRSRLSPPLHSLQGGQRHLRRLLLAAGEATPNQKKEKNKKSTERSEILYVPRPRGSLLLGA